jgi:hypothetical protein
MQAGHKMLKQAIEHLHVIDLIGDLQEAEEQEATSSSVTHGSLRHVQLQSHALQLLHCHHPQHCTKGIYHQHEQQHNIFLFRKRFVKTKAFKTAIDSSTNLVPKFSIPAESGNQNIQVLNCMPFCQHLYNDSTHLHPREIQAQYHHQATIALFKQFHHELQN